MLKSVFNYIKVYIFFSFPVWSVYKTPELFQQSVKRQSCLVSNLAASINLPDCLISVIGLAKASTTNDAGAVCW